MGKIVIDNRPYGSVHYQLFSTIKLQCLSDKMVLFLGGQLLHMGNSGGAATQPIDNLELIITITITNLYRSQDSGVGNIRTQPPLLACSSLTLRTIRASSVDKGSIPASPPAADPRPPPGVEPLSLPEPGLICFCGR